MLNYRSGIHGTNWAFTELASAGTYDFTAVDQIQTYTAAASPTQLVMGTGFETPSFYTCGAATAGNTCSGAGVNNNGNCWARGDGNCNLIGAPPSGGNCATSSQDSFFGCDPPIDLPSANGSGTDAAYIAYLTALFNHVGVGKIKYWESWNEADFGASWAGSKKQALRMMCDAFVTIKAIDPSVKILNPPQSNGTTTWLAGFLANSNVLPAGLGPAACSGTGCHASDCMDIVGTHSYIGSSGNANPDQIITVLSNDRSVMTGAYASLQLFDTEADWPNGSFVNSSCPDSNQNCAHTRSAWVSRTLILGFFGQSGTAGFNSMTLYGNFGKHPPTDSNTCAGVGPECYNKSFQSWDSWDTGAHTSCGQTITMPGQTCGGLAQTQVATWIAGGTAGRCIFTASGSGKVYFCPYVGSDAKQKVIVWDADASCFNTAGSGGCLASPYTPLAGYNVQKYEHLWDTSYTSCGGLCSSIAIDDRPTIFSAP